MKESIKRRLSASGGAGVVGYCQLTVCTGVILASTSQTFAYHDSGEDGAEMGGVSIGGILPIVVGAVVVMIGLGLWGRKKPRTESGRRKRRY